MVDKELLSILVCPDTHQSLAEATAEDLARVNAAIEAKSAKTVGDEAVDAPLDAGLIREDGQVIYPIREGIPVLLVEEGIRL